MSQDKENVSRGAANSAAITEEALSEADKFTLLSHNMMSALKELPKLCADSMSGVISRIENTVSNMEKLLSNKKPQKDKK